MGTVDLPGKSLQVTDSRKSLLITGCSSGIGYDVAHGMAARGWRVLAACRKKSDCERLEGEGLESLVLDYEDQPGIQEAAREVLARTDGGLDAVFNNGAYAIPGLLEDLPTDALRANFEANFFGHHELTRCLLPAFRRQGHGRILMNSSVLGFFALPWRGSYNSTKFAVEGWADTLRRELRNTGIRVILIEPGPITSNIRQNSIPHYERWIDAPSSARAEEYRKRLEPRLYSGSTKPDPFELPASAVTRCVVHALTHPNPRPRYRVTVPTKFIYLAKRFMTTRMTDRFMSRG